MIEKNWDRYFPGTNFSKALLNSKVNKYFAEKKEEEMTKIIKQLNKTKLYIKLMDFLFSKWQVVFVATAVASIFAIPFELYWILSESNLGFRVGLFSFFLNIVFFVYFYRKA